uniref:Ig-like domain-containing protein n=1 Tax=Anas platyrhynchos TaxID=8839 RepID=A0A8B9QMC5_ANAPL
SRGLAQRTNSSREVLLQLQNSVNNEKLFFGTGTKLTVIEKNDVIKPPAVAIFSPSKQEIQEKSKATLVCLASGFYPDTLNLVWKVNGAERTEGVGTDETSTSYENTYSLTSRLRISSQEWFNPLNRFECVANFFKNGTQESIHRFIYGDAGCIIFKGKLNHCFFLLLTKYLLLCANTYVCNERCVLCKSVSVCPVIVFSVRHGSLCLCT